MLLPLLLSVAAATLAVHGRSSNVGREFQGETFDLPPGFLVGAGSSALQVEGSEHADGKSPSVFDLLVEQMSNVTDLPPGLGGIPPPGTAADSYHRYKEDVQMAKDLKLNMYRFSISWPRVLPEGDPDKPNQIGIDYYNNLINELLKNGIEPMVTMNHGDQPYAVLEKTGGWADKRIVDAFTAYADFLFKTFGDRVKWWTTINEPNFLCQNFALIPVAGVYDRKPGDDYKCVHNSILAHMKAYRLYEKQYKALQGGRIGAASLTLWCTPNSTSYEDIQAAERANVFALGSIYHPVVYGDYPPAVRDRVDHYSRLEGRNESRLPRFTANETQELKGCADFLSFNAYMATTVADGTFAARPSHGTIDSDRDAIVVGADNTPGHFGNAFAQAHPWVLREAPKWIHKNYKMPIFITENGWGDQREGDTRRDSTRVGYHSSYLYELMRAVKEDNVQVLGYMVWSLLDSFEFTAGFSRKFGLVHVDYEGGSLDRSLKDSAWFFQYIGTHQKVPKIDLNVGSGSTSNTPAFALAALAFAVVSCLL